MARSLPPFHALRAFEAAARHLSFTRAAQELCVTHGAVSHQIKGLEAYLGVRLFRRLPQGVQLTEDGQAYFAVLREVFTTVEAATLQLQTRQGRSVLRVNALPTFTMRWLIPRLPAFSTAHAEIEVRLTTSIDPIDFDRNDVDVAIRRGTGNWPGLRADYFLDEDFFPVCSPQLLAGPHPLRVSGDLAHHTLLHTMTRREAWQLWLQAAGVQGVDAERGLVFEHFYFALQAASEGLGVAIGPRPLVASDLAEGRLVAPFAITVPSNHAYYLLCPEAMANVPKIATFRTWLLTEARGAAVPGPPEV
jgi:LysR family glycine cleavage system transcriptional activator